MRRRAAILAPGLALVLGLCAIAGIAGCSDPAIETVQMRLSSPFAFDPTAVETVKIAVVSQPKSTCVRAAGTNVCGELSSVEVAASAEGYVTQHQLDRQSGATATFSDLPEGRTCFVADAFNASGTILANGCAEVDLRLDLQRIEIALTTSP